MASPTSTVDKALSWVEEQIDLALTTPTLTEQRRNQLLHMAQGVLTMLHETKAMDFTQNERRSELIWRIYAYHHRETKDDHL